MPAIDAAQLIHLFDALPPAEQRRFLAARGDAGLLALAIRHVGQLVEMHAELLPFLLQHSNRSFRIRRKPARDFEEDLRRRHDDKKLSYAQIARVEGMARAAVRAAVRRARQRKFCCGRLPTGH